jgi:hypothetical protein
MTHATFSRAGLPAKEYRELDASIQQANWQIELYD